MIKEVIDKFYVAKQAKDKEKTAFWISDAGKCPRSIWFSMKGYPKKQLDAKTMRIFEHGEHTHMRIMAVLFSLGLVKACEIEIPETEMIHGRADAIISKANELYVIEVKSVNSVKFRKDQPDSDHVKQIQLYMHFFKINKGILVYENKDTQEIKEFLVELDEDLINELLSSFADLKRHIDSASIPEIPKDLERWRCEYCTYADECRKM